MSGENVKNFFEQPGPDGDNKFVCGGTTVFATGIEGDMTTLSGQNIAAHTLMVDILVTTVTTVFVNPGFVGALIAIHAAQNGTLGGSGSATVQFSTYTDAAGPFTSITNSDIVMPVTGNTTGDLFEAEPTTAARNFTAATGLRIVSVPGSATGTVTAKITLDFLLF